MGEREEEVEEQTDQTFYWDSSATETDTESEPDVESELNNEIESLPTNEQSRSASGTFGQLPLRWNQDAGKNLRGAYGSGSRSTHKRERRIESVSVHSLGEFHAHNFAHAISPPLHGASWWPCTSTCLQKRRTTSGFRRSETSPSPHKFLELQLAEHTKRTRRDRALSVAQGAGKGYAFGRRIVQWEISWVQDRVIPRRGQGGGRGSWMNDDDIAQSVRYFARQEGDSK